MFSTKWKKKNDPNKIDWFQNAITILKICIYMKNEDFDEKFDIEYDFIIVLCSSIEKALLKLVISDWLLWGWNAHNETENKEWRIKSPK